MVNKLTIDILDPFLSKPKEKLHLAQLSSEARTPHPTARLKLNRLEEQGLLRKELKGRLTLYSLNKENPLLLSRLVIAEKNRLMRLCEESLLLKEFVSHLQMMPGEDIKAIIFGSAAENPQKAGDIDLLVIGKIDESEIRKLSSRLNKKIHLIGVRSIGEVTPALREEIIKKHLIIRGSEELVKWILWSHWDGAAERREG